MFDGDAKTRRPGPRLPPPPAGLQAEPRGFSGVRLSVGEAETALRNAADRLAPERPFFSREPFNILALSGGAAGGAFGAGLLVGLSRAGRRPDFAIVTGVSTGALIAPFAFLGSSRDQELVRAYTGGEAAKLLSLRRLATAFGPGVFRAAPLEALVAPYVTRALLDDIAGEHARGRRLLVATTDLDRQATSIWDLGAVASHPGPDAVRLFRDLLVASASFPGLFAPKLIEVEANGETYQEMHVDGGASAPLFVMPAALLQWREVGRRLRRGRVYVIVNTVLSGQPRPVQPGLGPVLIRSLDTVLRFSYHQALSVTTTWCARHGLPLSVASIPQTFDGLNLLRFESATMQRIFDHAVELATTGQVWLSPTPEPAIWSGLLKRTPWFRAEPEPASPLPSPPAVSQPR